MQDPTDLSRLAYTAREVAAMLGVSERHVYESCRRDELPHLRIGRRVIFPKRRFEQWLNGESDTAPRTALGIRH